MEILFGILLPFLGTSIGASLVFFIKNKINDLVEKILYADEETRTKIKDEQIKGIEELDDSFEVGDTEVLAKLGLDDVILDLNLLDTNFTKYPNILDTTVGNIGIKNVIRNEIK